MQTEQVNYLIPAALMGNVTEGQKMFSLGLIDLSSKDVFIIPMYFAVINRHWDFVDFLISKGADINNEKDYNNISLLHNASEANNATDVIMNLLKRGVDVNRIAEKDGRTGLHCSCSIGNLENVKLLVQNGANVNAISKIGKTPIQEAIQNGHDGVAQYLLQNGANMNTVEAVQANKDAHSMMDMMDNFSL